MVFPESDPRVFFAAERTMLAWLRSGIASIGLGFLVARFGYFLRMVSGGATHAHQSSTLIGIGFVALGTGMIAVSAWQHRQFVRTLRAKDLPHHYSARVGIVLALLMVLAGVALAVYLAMSTANVDRSIPQPAATVNLWAEVPSPIV